MRLNSFSHALTAMQKGEIIRFEIFSSNDPQQKIHPPKKTAVARLLQSGIIQWKRTMMTSAGAVEGSGIYADILNGVPMIDCIWRDYCNLIGDGIVGIDIQIVGVQKNEEN